MLFVICMMALLSMGVAVMVVFLAKRWPTTQGTGCSPAVRYDEMRFNLFNSTLNSLSIAAGIKPPRLAVMKLPSPNSYGIDSGYTPMICVTPSLLEQELTDQQMEAIMAVAVAKILLGPRGKLPAEKSAPPLEVRADILAVRITKQPRALEEAIVKVAEWLTHAPARPRGVTPSRMFLEPPLPGPWNRARNRARLEMIKSRLENLEKMERGTWQPFERVRDSKPVTLPTGWE